MSLTLRPLSSCAARPAPAALSSVAQDPGWEDIRGPRPFTLHHFTTHTSPLTISLFTIHSSLFQIPHPSPRRVHHRRHHPQRLLALVHQLVAQRDLLP